MVDGSSFQAKVSEDSFFSSREEEKERGCDVMKRVLVFETLRFLSS